MTASTRRAALGAILAAPLASVPVAATPPPLPDHEVRFLAIGPQLVALMDEYDRLWPLGHAAYEAWSKAKDGLPIPQWKAAERLPEWQAYLAAREPADAVNDQIERLHNPGGLSR